MEFLLYRLNYEQKPNLFHRAISDNGDLASVLAHAADSRWDVEKSRSNVGFRWSLREFHIVEEDGRAVVVLTLARSSLYKAGVSVTESGFQNAISTSTPALAERIIILLDMSRHVFAVEYNSNLMQSDTWRKEFERMMARSAHSLGFYTRIVLIPVAPREEFEIRLQRFEQITRVRLTLTLPNPDISSTYARLYREMMEGGVQQLRQDMSNPQGLNMSDGALPRASLDMAMNGYKRGPIKVRGKAGGRPDGITIGEEVTRTEIEGVREYAEGISRGADDPKVRRAVRSIIKKIDDLLLEQVEHRPTREE